MNELNVNGEGKPSVTSLGTTAPNEASFAGMGHVGSSHALGRGAPTAMPPNQGFAADKTGSSSPQPKGPSPMSPPDMKFSIGDARMSQPQSAVVAGKGQVPVRSDHVGMSASYTKKA